jgi:hypothetical protein
VPEFPRATGGSFSAVHRFHPQRRLELHGPSLWRDACFSRLGSVGPAVLFTQKEEDHGQIVVIQEVSMQFTRYNAVRSGADVISGILNCVCPQCGGRMGGRGREFTCQGECLTDWRQVWELASAEFGMRSKRGPRRSSAHQLSPIGFTEPSGASDAAAGNGTG